MIGHPYCTHDEGEACRCAAELFTQSLDSRPHRRTQVWGHTDRRAEVRQLRAQGLTAKDIARQTGMHVRTVERHMAKIKKGEVSV